MGKNSFVFYSYLGQLSLFFIASLIWLIELQHSLDVFLFAVLNSLVYITVLRLRIYCLKYMSSSSYFINYRIFSSILLLCLWQILFFESINFKEYLGIILWFVSFYLLLGDSNIKNNTNKNQWGYIYLLLSVILISILWSAQKYITNNDYDVNTFILYCWFTWLVYTFISKWKESLRSIVSIKSRKHLLFLVTSFFVFPFGFYFHMLALASGWEMAIVYKIVSYSLFIPIFFSIIYYKEQLTLKKVLAFGLTLISIGLFV